MPDEEKKSPAPDELDGVEADDPNIPDTDAPDDEANEDAEGLDLRALLGLGKEDDEDFEEDEEDDEAPVTKKAATPNKAKAEPELTKEADEVVDPFDVPRFSQNQLNEFVKKRNAHDKQIQAVRNLEALIGKPLSEYLESLTAKEVEETSERFGMSDAEAKKYIEAQTTLRLQAIEQAERAQETAQREKANRYTEAKRKMMRDPQLNAFIKAYESDIDQFSDFGQMLDFEPAMDQILGQKLRAGELYKKLSDSVEQRVISDVQKRGRTGQVENASQPGSPDAYNGLSPVEKRIARRLGVSPQDYAKEKQRLEKRRGRR